MGTRHLIAVMLDQQYRIAQYGQWDGYPSAQGATVLDFLREKMKREVFEKQLRAASFLNQAEMETINQVFCSKTQFASPQSRYFVNGHT